MTSHNHHPGPRQSSSAEDSQQQQHQEPEPVYVSEVSFCGSVPQICAPPSGPKLAAQRVKQHRSGSSSAKQQLLERSHATANQRPEPPKLRAAASDPLNSKVWTVDETGELCLRDGQTGSLLLASAPASESTGGAAANALLWTKNKATSHHNTNKNFLWAAFTTGKILVVDPESGNLIQSISTGSDGAMCLTESRCGRYIFVGGVTGSVSAYSSSAPFAKLGSWADEHRRLNPDALVLSVASSTKTAEFGFIATGGSDGSVLLWEPEESDDNDNNDDYVKKGSNNDDERSLVSLNVVRQFENATLYPNNNSSGQRQQEAAVLALLCVEVEYENIIEERVVISNDADDQNDSAVLNANESSTPPPQKQQQQRGKSPRQNNNNNQQSPSSSNTPIGGNSSRNVTPNKKSKGHHQQNTRIQRRVETDVVPFVWVGSAGGKVVVWNCATGEVAWETQLHDHSVSHFFSAPPPPTNTEALLKNKNDTITADELHRHQLNSNNNRIWSAGLDGKVVCIDSKNFTPMIVLQQPTGVQCVTPVSTVMAWRLWACAVDGSAQAYVFQVQDSRVAELLQSKDAKVITANGKDENATTEREEALLKTQQELLEKEKLQQQIQQERDQLVQEEQKRIITDLREELAILANDYDKQMVAMQDEIYRLRSEKAEKKAADFLMSNNNNQNSSSSSPSKNNQMNDEDVDPMMLSAIEQQQQNYYLNNGNKNKTLKNKNESIIKDDEDEEGTTTNHQQQPVVEIDLALAELEDTELFSRWQLNSLETEFRENLRVLLQHSIFAELRKIIVSTPTKTNNSNTSYTGTPAAKPFQSSSSKTSSATTNAGEREKFQNDLADLNLRLAERNREVEAIRELLETEKKRADREISSAKLSLQQEIASERQKLQTQLLETERASRKTETLLRDAQLELTTLRAKDQNKNDTSTHLHQQIDDLEKKCAEALEREKAAHTRSDKLVQELEESRKTLNARSQAVNSALDSNATLRERCDNLEDDLQKMSDEVAASRESYENEKQDLLAKNEKLHKDLLSMRGPWESMKTALRDSHQSLEDLRSEFEQLEEELSFERSENERLKQMHQQQSNNHNNVMINDRMNFSPPHHSNNRNPSRGGSPSIQIPNSNSTLQQVNNNQQQQNNNNNTSNSNQSSRASSNFYMANHNEQQQQQQQPVAEYHHQQGSLPRALDAVIERFSSVPR